MDDRKTRKVKILNNVKLQILVGTQVNKRKTVKDYKVTSDNTRNTVYSLKTSHKTPHKSKPSFYFISIIIKDKPFNLYMTRSPISCRLSYPNHSIPNPYQNNEKKGLQEEPVN